MSPGPGLDPHPDPQLWDPCAELLSLQSMDSSDLSDGPITLQEYLEVKKALAASEAKVQQLMKVNNSLSDELRRLQREVGVGPAGLPSSTSPLSSLTLFPFCGVQIHKLQAENTQIRQQTGPAHPTPAPSERQEHGHPPGTAPPHRRDRQAFSMYEPGSALKPFGQPVEELVTRLQPFSPGVSVVGWTGRVLGCSSPPSPAGRWVPSPQGHNLSCVARRWRTRLCTPCTSRPACTG